jgi:hypothetical protein
MTYEEICNAISIADKIMVDAERLMRRGIEMGAGKLHKLCLPPQQLCELKRELQSFDMHRKKWRK